MTTPRPAFDRWAYWYRRALPAYWIALACITHFPKLSIPGHVPQSDKLAHASAYALLAFLYWRFARAIRRPPRLPSCPTSASNEIVRRAAPGHGPVFVWVTLAVLGAYAAIDELTQPWFGRDCDITDWLMDLTGVIVVLTLLEWRRRRRARPRPNAIFVASAGDRS